MGAPILSSITKHYPKARLFGYTTYMVHKRILSFGHALKGLRVAWQEEAHFKFHVSAGCVALLASWAFHITTTELLFVLVMTAMVMSAEIFNAALEEICDKYTPEHDPHIGKIKDLAAAAVLVTSCVAFVVGAIIFLPYIIFAA